MKRRLLIIAIFLLLGAVVNVAVAWGCAMWLPGPLFRLADDYRDSDRMADVYVAAGMVRIHSHWLAGSSNYVGVEPKYSAGEILPAWGGFARPSGTYPPDTFVFRSVDARGWPVVSLWSGLESTGFPGSVRRARQGRGWPVVSLWSGLESTGFPGPAPTIGNMVPLINGYLLPAERSKRVRTMANVLSLRVVPLMPIWPGFAVNTLFYATLLWLLIWGLSTLRRILRVRRGLCPKCAYPMGRSAVCTECGGVLARRA